MIVRGPNVLDVALKHEPPDLADLDETEQHREVYAWAGLALYHAQAVEVQVARLLLVARIDDGSLIGEYESADAFLDAHDNGAFGRLITDVRRHIELPADTEHRLGAALTARNRFVHHYFQDHIEGFTGHAGRQRMVNELHELAEMLSNTDDELTTMTFDLGAAYGLTPAAVDAQLAERKARR